MIESAGNQLQASTLKSNQRIKADEKAETSTRKNTSEASTDDTKITRDDQLEISNQRVFQKQDRPEQDPIESREEAFTIIQGLGGQLSGNSQGAVAAQANLQSDVVLKLIA